MITMLAKDVSKLLIPYKARLYLRECAAALSVKQLYGPKSIELGRNEAVVTCVVKNGEFYINQFIKHYTTMGFRHIFFLDNGSTDNTLTLARKHDNVSICQSGLPIDGNQRLFKKYLAQRSGLGGWCLDADIDEFFDYPFSNVVSLGQFLTYLNDNRFTAVITQLLDMFADRPLSHLAKTQTEELKEVYRYYDVCDISSVPYREAELAAGYGRGNTVTNNTTALLFGGVRKKLYGKEWLTNCLLTKHSLFLPGEGLELFPHVHFVDKARLADISCPVLHYKLTSNALETALQNQTNFVGISKGYGAFADFLISNPNWKIRKDTSAMYINAESLVGAGFLFSSDHYYKYVRRTGHTPATSINTDGGFDPGKVSPVTGTNRQEMVGQH
jgi:hypothetical protein